MCVIADSKNFKTAAVSEKSPNTGFKNSYNYPCASVPQVSDSIQAKTL